MPDSWNQAKKAKLIFSYEKWKITFLSTSTVIEKGPQSYHMPIIFQKEKHIELLDKVTCTAYMARKQSLLLQDLFSSGKIFYNSMKLKISNYQNRNLLNFC